MELSSVCPSCGQGIHPDDAYCRSCGTRVREDASNRTFVQRSALRQTVPPRDRRECGSCNAPLLEGEIFCPVCGARSDTNAPGPTGQVPILEQLKEATQGHFEFVRELGRGGMGAVYLARELDLDRFVAIKALSADWLTDDAMVERFRREAKVIASLRHPSIVHIHGVGKANDIHYFVMDYIDGTSLGRLLRAQGPMPLPGAQALFYQVGSALSYAHRPARGVIHRDVKPSNIMLDVEGNAFVTDFGISKVAEAQTDLTLTGLIMGTPEYMSPEQCRGDVVSFSSDQYALGVVLYSMLTGKPPFTGPYYRVLTGHTQEQPPPIQDLRPDCPDELAQVVHRMLAKEPRERWPDIRDAMKAAKVKPMMPDDPGREEVERLVFLTRSADSGTSAEPGPGEPDEESAGTPTPTTLRISGAHQALEPGDQVKLTATALFDDGQEVDGESVTWGSTDPSVARIDPTTGELVAVGAGSAVITARAAGVSESVPVDVVPMRVARLTLEPEWLELEPGRESRLVAKPFSRGGDVLDYPVIWSSSDPGVVTTTDEGRVQARSLGSATVMAQCQSTGAAAKVDVIPATVAAVTLPGAPDHIQVGRAVTLAADVVDPGGMILDRQVYWSVSDPTVAEITESGELRGLQEGSVTVTAESGGQTASHSMIVQGTPAAGEAASAQVRGGAAAEATPGTPLRNRKRLALWAVPVVALLGFVGVWAALTFSSGPQPGPSATEGPTPAGGPSVPAAAGTPVEEGPEIIAGDTGPPGDPSAVGIPMPTPSAEGLEEGPPSEAEGPEGEQPQAAKPDPSAGAAGQRTPQPAAERPGEDEAAAARPEPGPPPPDGELLLMVRPWATVLIDEVQRGDTVQRQVFSLPPGEHRLRLQNPNMIPFDTVFHIQSEARIEIAKVLRRKR